MLQTLKNYFIEAKKHYYVRNPLIVAIIFTCLAVWILQWSVRFTMASFANNWAETQATTSSLFGDIASNGRSQHYRNNHYKAIIKRDAFIMPLRYTVNGHKYRSARYMQEFQPQPGTQTKILYSREDPAVIKWNIEEVIFIFAIGIRKNQLMGKP